MTAVILTVICVIAIAGGCIAEVLLQEAYDIVKYKNLKERYEILNKKYYKILVENTDLKNQIHNMIVNEKKKST